MLVVEEQTGQVTPVLVVEKVEVECLEVLRPDCTLHPQTGLVHPPQFEEDICLVEDERLAEVLLPGRALHPQTVLANSLQFEEDIEHIEQYGKVVEEVRIKLEMETVLVVEEVEVGGKLEMEPVLVVEKVATVQVVEDRAQ